MQCASKEKGLWFLTTYDKIIKSAAILHNNNGVGSMPRPRKQKKICALPRIDAFGPADVTQDQSDVVNMSIEEYEAIRLIDYEDLTQEQCAEVMCVARSTIQRIYMDARKKLADCIINGKGLKIGGGHYTLCNKRTDQTICEGCNRHRHQHGRAFNQN